MRVDPAGAGWRTPGSHPEDGYELDYFQARNVDWPTMALDHGRRERAPLGAFSPRWDEQGSLYNIAGGPYAVRFDQRSAGDGLRTFQRVEPAGRCGVTACSAFTNRAPRARPRVDTRYRRRIGSPGTRSTY